MLPAPRTKARLFKLKGTFLDKTKFFKKRDIRHKVWAIIKVKLGINLPSMYLNLIFACVINICTQCNQTEEVFTKKENNLFDNSDTKLTAIIHTHIHTK